MSEIHGALMEAWDALPEATKKVRLGLLMQRRAAGIRARPLRPWCVAIRASDLRLNGYWCIVEAADLNDPGAGQWITITGDVVRKLCKPVSIDWPGMDWCLAADKLGRRPMSLSNHIKRGVFQVSYYPPAPLSKRGKPVPVIWSHSPLDASASNLKGPDVHWGTVWQWLWERIPEGMVFTVKRTERLRPYPGRYGVRMRHRGWTFSCPRCGVGSDRLFYPLEPLTLPEWLGVVPRGVEWVESEKRKVKSENADSTAREEGEPRTANGEPGGSERGAGKGERSEESGAMVLVGRRGEMREAKGESGEGEGGALTAQDGREGGKEELVEGVALSASSTAADTSPGGRGREEPFACRACHGILSASLVDKNGWNVFVQYVSGGVLYGREVKRPEWAKGERRRPFGRRVREPEKHAELFLLLRSGLTYERIAARLGMNLNTLSTKIGRLRERYGARSRGELVERARMLVGRASQGKGRAVRGKRA